MIRTKWELCYLDSITHYAQLLTFLPTGSAAVMSARIIIDKMSHQEKKKKKRKEITTFTENFLRIISLAVSMVGALEHSTF